MTLGKVMGSEVILTDSGTRLVPLFVRRSQRGVEEESERDSRRQTVRDRG